MENTSGSGKTAVVPAEIDRWNWGAFLLTWIWGLGNNTLIALLVFVPFINMAMPFVLGAKGSQWAWRNKRWESVEAFKAMQRKWTLWGLVVIGLSIIFFVGLFAVLMTSFKTSDAYQMTVRALNSNSEAVQILGQPIATGFPLGSFEVSGPSGQAHLSFSAKGPKGNGTVYVDATKSLGQWKIDQAVLEDSTSGKRVNIAE